MTEAGRLTATLSATAAAVARSAPALAGSKFLPFDFVRDAPLSDGHLLIVGFWDDLEASILEYAYSVSLAEGPTVSFALGGTKDELAEALGANARQEERDYCGQLAILNYLDLAEAQGEGWTILGRLASRERVEQKLAGTPASLLISTHGDGLDARLPADLHLCPAPWEEAGRERTEPNAPFCAVSRRCYWLDAPFGSDSCRRQLLTADRLSAGTIIFDSCLAMQSGEGLFPSRSLFLRQLAARADCEEIVCFSGYQIEDGQRLLDMSYELATGASAAELVRLYNQAASSRALGRRAYLLHGRRWRAGRTQEMRRAQPQIRERKLSLSRVPETGLQRAEAWMRWLAGCAGETKEERIAASLGVLLRPGLGESARTEALADLLCGIDTMSLWRSRLGTGTAPPTQPCPVCGTVLAAAAGDDEGIVRVFAQCHSCNYYSDSDGVERGKAILCDDGAVVVRGLRAGSEVRIRTAPAGCPKYPVRILRLDDPGASPEFGAPVERSTALSFRADGAATVHVDLAARFERPPLFIAVVIADEDGYCSETFTTRSRAHFRQRAPAAAEPATAP